MVDLCYFFKNWSNSHSKLSPRVRWELKSVLKFFGLFITPKINVRPFIFFKIRHVACIFFQWHNQLEISRVIRISKCPCLLNIVKSHNSHWGNSQRVWIQSYSDSFVVYSCYPSHKKVANVSRGIAHNWGWIVLVFLKKLGERSPVPPWCRPSMALIGALSTSVTF